MGSRSLPVRPVLLLWLAVSAALLWSGWGHVVNFSGWDPDDQLRMVQLRDFLHGQSWFDTTQYRMNPPAGAPMHWSRLIELPLALIVVALTPLIGEMRAEIVAGAAVPLLLLGAISYMLGRIATRLANAEAGVVAAFLALVSPALLMQLRPMRIDHHGWQIAMAVLALWTMFWPSKKFGGIVLGAALAIWMHISLEGAPMMVAFFVLLGWRWVVERAQGKRLFWSIASFAGMSVLLFAATQAKPFSAFPFCDSISPPHIAAIIVAAVIMMPAIAMAPDHRRFRLLATGVAGAAALGVMLLIAPQCAGGAFGGLDPLVREYWYVNVSEGLPIWRQAIGPVIMLTAGPLMGLVALYVIGGGSKEIRVSGFFLIYAIILSFLVFRTISVAAAFAIPLTAIWINNAFQVYRRSGVPAQRIGLVALMLALIIPGPIAIQLYNSGEQLVTKPDPKEAVKEANVDKCESVESVGKLAQLKNARFIAPFDMTPAILLTTPNMVLASSHHRNRQGMHDHIEIFRSAPDASHALLAKHGITHLAACPGEDELQFYVDKDPNGLWAQIEKGHAPAWLTPLPDMGKGIKVWQVR